MENSKKINLFEQDIKLPCSRVVNGFRLSPEFLDSEKKVLVWTILPNRSTFTFYFCSLDKAESFAKSFVNNHSDDFWYRRWYNVHSRTFCLSHFKLI